MTLTELHERAMALLEEQLNLIEAEVAKTGRYDPHLANMATNIARGVASLTGEVRKRDASIKRQVAEKTEEERLQLIKAFVMSLNKERLREIKAFVSEL